MRLEKRDAVVTTRVWHRVINGKIFKFAIVEYPRAIHVQVWHEYVRGLPNLNTFNVVHDIWFYKDKKRSR